jgi:hypothetical protein
MDEIDWLQTNVKIAAAPQLDVAGRVMQTLRASESAASSPPPQTRMWIAIALASWAFAAVSVLVAQQAIWAWQDPLGDLLRL